MTVEGLEGINHIITNSNMENVSAWKKGEHGGPKFVTYSSWLKNMITFYIFNPLKRWE